MFAYHAASLGANLGEDPFAKSSPTTGCRSSSACRWWRCSGLEPRERLASLLGGSGPGLCLEAAPHAGKDCTPMRGENSLAGLLHSTGFHGGRASTSGANPAARRPMVTQGVRGMERAVSAPHHSSGKRNPCRGWQARTALCPRPACGPRGRLFAPRAGNKRLAPRFQNMTLLTQARQGRAALPWR